MKTAIVSVLVLLWWTAFASPVMELYPFAIVGRLVNADNVAYDATSSIIVYAEGLDGRRLATTSVVTPGSDSPWNFFLDLAYASSSLPGYVTKGDKVLVSALVGDRTYKTTFEFGVQTIGEPGGAIYLRLMLAEDTNENGIADSYEETMLDEMWALGIEGDYEPEADYDGDKVSNRDEYLAGTDPFDASDFFSVKEVDSADDAFFGVTFEANAGRIYSVNGSSDLKAWSRKDIRQTPDAAEPSVGYVATGEREWAVKTVYLLKEGPAQFYRVEMNDETIGLGK